MAGRKKPQQIELNPDLLAGLCQEKVRIEARLVTINRALEEIKSWEPDTGAAKIVLQEGR